MSKLYQYRILLDQFNGTMNITMEKARNCIALDSFHRARFCLMVNTSRRLAANCNEAKPKANNQKAQIHIYYASNRK